MTLDLSKLLSKTFDNYFISHTQIERFFDDSRQDEIKITNMQNATQFLLTLWFVFIRVITQRMIYFS